MLHIKQNLKQELENEAFMHLLSGVGDYIIDEKDKYLTDFGMVYLSVTADFDKSLIFVTAFNNIKKDLATTILSFKYKLKMQKSEHIERVNSNVIKMY